MWRAVLVAALLSATPATAQTFIDAGRDGLLEAQTPPPADDTLAGAADLVAVLVVQGLRDGDVEVEARIDGDLPALTWALRALGPGYDPAYQPAAFALFDAVRVDMTRAVDMIKAQGAQRVRPHQRDPRVKPSLSIEGHGSNSWPSGRAAATRVWAGVLTDLFPERAPQLEAAADRSATLRLIGGVHYPTDLVEGKRLADMFLERLRANSTYRTQIQRAKVEMQTSASTKRKP
jgi:acid phosphatase (class A)